LGFDCWGQAAFDSIVRCASVINGMDLLLDMKYLMIKIFDQAEDDSVSFERWMAISMS
jgi:hypothetical protein